MTVLASESQGIVGNLDIFTFPLPMLFPFFCIAIAFLLGFLFHGDNSTILFSALCAIGRALRPVGRALRWLFDHFNLGMAWACACATVLLSFLLLLNAFYGLPVSLFDSYVFFTGCVLSWGFERFYISELKADARFQAKQRGEL